MRKWGAACSLGASFFSWSNPLGRVATPSCLRVDLRIIPHSTTRHRSVELRKEFKLEDVFTDLAMSGHDKRKTTFRG